MSELPSSSEIGRIIDFVLLVEAENRLLGELLLIGERDDRMRGERQLSRRQQHMIRDVLRGGVVLLEEVRRHDERLAGIRKTLARSRVDRKRISRSEINASQIADGVVVFGVAQSPRQHDSRITGGLAGFEHHQLAQHGEHVRPLFGARLLRVWRRHLFLRDEGDDVLPLPIIRRDQFRTRVLRQIQLTLGRLLVVTLDAVGLHERQDGVAKRVGGLGSLPVESQGDQQSNKQQTERVASERCHGRAVD